MCVVTMVNYLVHSWIQQEDGGALSQVFLNNATEILPSTKIRGKEIRSGNRTKYCSQSEMIRLCKYLNAATSTDSRQVYDWSAGSNVDIRKHYWWCYWWCRGGFVALNQQVSMIHLKGHRLQCPADRVSPPAIVRRCQSRCLHPLGYPMSNATLGNPQGLAVPARDKQKSFKRGISLPQMTN